jgi:diguanylate cyclase (GGDEF)-like protein
MLEGHFFNPAIQGTMPAVVQIFATFLFCGIFLFLWRHSGVVYFGFWSLAWGVETLALFSSFGAFWSGSAAFLWLRALLEFGFALALLTAGRSAAGATFRGIRSALRSLLLFPGLLFLIYVFGWRLPIMPFRAVHATVLALIYGYSFLTIGCNRSLQKGIGGNLLRFSLFCLFLQFTGHAAIYVCMTWAGSATWMGIFRWIDLYDLIPQTFLAFSAVAMWIQTQQDSIESLRRDLEIIHQESRGTAELDHLTGLQNRLALDIHLMERFSGVVAVCDLDYFKDINDRFGHLVGDEVLRSVGHLIRASIRELDSAFRWGGDEFVILFRDQHIEMVEGRMTAIELRMKTFRIRGHGLFPLGLSWGAAEGDGELLRPILEEADLQMYEQKRRTHARKS